MTIDLTQIESQVIIIAAVISMVTAWGMFGTRLSVVEEKVISIGTNLVEIRQIIKDLRKEDMDGHEKIRVELKNLESRVRKIENSQAQLKGLLHIKKK